MAIVKTSDLIGPALDWAVAVAEGYTLYSNAGKICCAKDGDEGFLTKYSTDWSQGGPIIEREKIELTDNCSNPTENWYWAAHIWRTKTIGYGSTALIAAMRCYIASKLGDTVEVPEELL